MTWVAQVAWVTMVCGVWQIGEGTGSTPAKREGIRKHSNELGKENQEGIRKQSSISDRRRGSKWHLEKVQD